MLESFLKRNNMIKVSVIIPVYGVEKYIERCARSLFEQTLEDMEFIFVNDCTKDNSVDILLKVINEYPQRKSHVHILNHEVNKGLPAARQTGIKAAKGEYIAHCDSDDWVSPDAYQVMYEIAVRENADMTICDFFVSDGVTHRPYYTTLHNKEENNLFVYINIWTRLVKHSLYENEIHYPNYAMFEDRVLSMQLTAFAKKVVTISKPLYYYFCNVESICRVFTEEKCVLRWKQAVANTNIVMSALERKGLTEKYPIQVCRQKYEARHQIAPLTNKYVYYKMWASCYPEINKVMFFSKSIKFSEHIRFILTYFRLFALLRK